MKFFISLYFSCSFSKLHYTLCRETNYPGGCDDYNQPAEAPCKSYARSIKEKDFAHAGNSGKRFNTIYHTETLPRRKEEAELFYVYTVHCTVVNEDRVLCLS